MDLQAEIEGLDGAKAERILSIFSAAHLRAGSKVLDWTEEMRSPLETALDIDSIPDEVPARGELARAALLVLMEEQQHRPVLQDLVRGPGAESFSGVETAAIVTAVMVVLQTQLKFERDKDGRISIRVEKKSTSDSVLKPLVQKLLSYLGVGS